MDKYKDSVPVRSKLIRLARCFCQKAHLHGTPPYLHHSLACRNLKNCQQICKWKNQSVRHSLLIWITVIT